MKRTLPNIWSNRIKLAIWPTAEEAPNCLAGNPELIMCGTGSGPDPPKIMFLRRIRSRVAVANGVNKACSNRGPGVISACD